MFISLTGCYHAIVETGATPSTEVIDNSFASSWIYGLVPPSIVSTAERCSNGVAKVETQHTFVNQLVGFLTLGIYTPMQIRVTCAARASAFADPASPRVYAKSQSSEAKEAALTRAVVLAAASEKLVYLLY
jgi:hypothetical protein